MRSLLEFLRAADKRHYPEIAALTAGAATGIAWWSGAPEYVCYPLSQVITGLYLAVKSLASIGLKVPRRPIVRQVPSERLVQAGIGLVQDHFGACPEVMNSEVMFEAYLKCPKSVALVCDRKNPDRVVGILELWRIREKSLEELLAGRKTESQLCADDFLSADEPAPRKIYAALTLENAWWPGIDREHLVAALSFGADNIRSQFFKSKKAPELEIFAIGATRHGRRLAADLGFVQRSKPSPTAPDVRVLHLSRARLDQICAAYALNRQRYDLLA